MEETDLLLLECYGRLIVETYIHPLDTANSSLSKIVSEEKIGLLSLHKLRQRLQLGDVDPDTSADYFISKDGVEFVLLPRELKENSYWFIWKEEVTLDKRVIPVIVDSMVQLPLKGTIKFKFPDVFYHDMRAIFDSSILLSDKETSENIDELFKRIVTAIQLPQKSSQINREDDNFASTPSILSSANNKKRHKKKREEITHDKEAEDPSTERQETKKQELQIEKSVG
eukprot:gene15780-17728_t